MTEYLKRCSKCKGYYPTSEFHANTAKPDGLQTECKRCQSENKNISARRYDLIDKAMDSIIVQPVRWVTSLVSVICMPFNWIDRLIPSKK